MSQCNLDAFVSFENLHAPTRQIWYVLLFFNDKILIKRASKHGKQQNSGGII